MSLPTPRPVPDAAALVADLEDARRRELELYAGLSDDQLIGPKQHLIEPPIWELGHVAWFQELWLLRRLAGERPLLPRGDGIYDSFNVSYKLRWEHDFPSRRQTLDYMAEVLERSTARLARQLPTAEEAYYYMMAAQHEDMHAENLALVRQTLGYAAPDISDPLSLPPPEPDFVSRDVEVPGGVFKLGAPPEVGFVWDNEKWAHPREVAPFRIAATPVTNAEFARFVDADGYRRREWWGRRGWDWRRREEIVRPLFWEKGPDGRWGWRRFGRWEPLDPWHPVIHVNWYEAEAWCRFAGRRLPTELEWEVAALGVPTDDGRALAPTQRRFPWGDTAPTPERANLDYRRLGTVDVRALPAGDSAFGGRQMIGNVWEWVQDTFEPYPGFEADAYREYSAPYFGQKKVLRGGAWTTRSRLIRGTWRNFYIRHRRNIFAGFRTCPL